LLLGKKKLNQKKVFQLINRLKGIEETQKLALKYIDIATSSAMNIDNKNIRKEMLNLLDASLYRTK
jgi:geranylgeranyl pyrophosphate synthase